MKRLSRLLVVTALLALAAPAPADVVFTTFGPGNSHDSTTGWTIGYVSPTWTQGDQFSFTGSQPYPLTSIEVAAAWVSGTNQMNVSLMTDNMGQPGTTLESFSFTNMGNFGDNNPLLVGTSVLHPLLTPGTEYWLVADAPSGTWDAWNWSSPQVLGLHAQSLDGGTTWSVGSDDVLGAFQINGGVTPVPVPGAVLLGALGLSVAGWRLKRNGA